MRTLRNIYWLGTKELRSLLGDYALLGLVVYAFSLAIVAQAQSSSQEVHNASVGIVDEDRSALSRRIVRAFLPPYFQAPQPVAERDIVPLMNAGKYTFIIDIPPNFERDVVGGREPGLQLNIDATAMVQAGLGADYATQIINSEIADFVSRTEGTPVPAVGLVARIVFNPNVETSWFTSVMGIINSITMLAIILAGAAIVREREHGTMDHLLVMPVKPFEIGAAKIWANSFVIIVAAGLSLYFIVRGLLHVPIAGSIPLFLAGTAVYLFFATAIGVFLGTIARSMPQLAAGVALGQQFAARKHAALDGCDRPILTHGIFCIVRPGDPLSRRRFHGRLEAVRPGPASGCIILWVGTSTVPQGRRSDHLTRSPMTPDRDSIGCVV